MKRYSILPGRISVSLPGYDVDRAGFAGMAFDSRFASIERAIMGSVFPITIFPSNGPGTNGRVINFGADFGLPPFFYCARADADSPSIDISHVDDFPPLAYSGKNVNSYRPLNSDQVTAWVTSTRAVMQINTNHSVQNTDLRFLALA